MILFPHTAYYNQPITKKTLYDHFVFPPSLKKTFNSQVKSIYWRYKISDLTVQIPKGSFVTEIQLLELNLTSENIDENILRFLDSHLNYHIVFLLEYLDQFQLVISYKKKKTDDKIPFQVIEYFHTDWKAKANLELPLMGDSLDNVYENFLRFIADSLLTKQQEVSLDNSIKTYQKKKTLEKQINSLMAKKNKEKQLNRQVEFSNQIRLLQKQLNELE